MVKNYNLLLLLFLSHFLPNPAFLSPLLYNSARSTPRRRTQVLLTAVWLHSPQGRTCPWGRPACGCGQTSTWTRIPLADPGQLGPQLAPKQLAGPLSLFFFPSLFVVTEINFAGRRLRGHKDPSKPWASCRTGSPVEGGGGFKASRQTLAEQPRWRVWSTSATVGSCSCSTQILTPTRSQVGGRGTPGSRCLGGARRS